MTLATIDHDDMDGAEPENLTPKDESEFERSLTLIQARRRALDREQWIGDEFEFIEKELVRLRAIKRPKGRQPNVYFVTAAEVLKAFDSKVIDRNETRKILGLGRKRQPAQLRRKAK
jgi:hypothetical protein